MSSHVLKPPNIKHQCLIIRELMTRQCSILLTFSGKSASNSGMQLMHFKNVFHKNV
jgi:hypothetical protein